MPGIDIPALVSKTGQPDVGGKVIAWSGSAFTLSVSSGTISTNYNGGALSVAYNGGSLNVAGVSTTITTVNTNGGVNVVNVTAAPTIPFVLHDDDDDTRLPATLPMTMMNQAFFEAYLMPLIDGGNDIANNQVGAVASVEFRRNATGAQLNAIAQRESASSETDIFWVIYVCSAWQYTPGSDHDAQTEGGTGGVCFSVVNNNIVATGGDASWVFVETCTDRMSTGTIPADAGLIERDVVHEIGHQMGLDHLSGTIMNSSQQSVPANTGFGDVHLNLLRSRTKSLGE